MRRLAHLSDLHFGRVDPAAVEGLLRSLEDARPDLVVVSGDFTQSARTGEFRAARAFLDRLPAPVFAVPGNHDLPQWNPVERLAAALRPLPPLHRAGARAGLVRRRARHRRREVAAPAAARPQPRRRPGRRAPARARARAARRHAAGAGARRRRAPPAAAARGPPRRPLPAHAFTRGAGRALAAFARHRVRLVLSGHLHLSYSRRHEPSGGRGAADGGAAGAGGGRDQGPDAADAVGPADRPGGDGDLDAAARRAERVQPDHGRRGPDRGRGPRLGRSPAVRRGGRVARR